MRRQVSIALAAVAAAAIAVPATATGYDDGGTTPVARPGLAGGVETGALGEPAALRARQGDGRRRLSGRRLGPRHRGRSPIRCCSPTAPRTSGSRPRTRSSSPPPPSSTSSGPTAGSRRASTCAAGSAGRATRWSAGDLVLVGDGDPAFGTGRFARGADQPATRVSELARNVAQAGVRRVKGRILADDTIFDRERRAGPDLSPLSGLSFNNGYEDGDYAKSPELVAAKGLKSALRKRGVRVGGRVGHANLPDRRARPQATGRDRLPDGAKLIEETNVPSNNFFAEMLLKRLGAGGGKRAPATAATSKVEALRRLGRHQGPGGRRLRPVAHATASRRSRSESCWSRWPPTSKSPRVRDSLPVAGREGRVADRMRGTAAEGNCADEDRDPRRGLGALRLLHAPAAT